MRAEYPKPEVDSCSATAAKWLSVAVRGPASALPACAGSTMGSTGCWTIRRTDAVGGSPDRRNDAHLVLHPIKICSLELRKREPKLEKKTEYEWWEDCRTTSSSVGPAPHHLHNPRDVPRKQ